MPVGMLMSSPSPLTVWEKMPPVEPQRGQNRIEIAPSKAVQQGAAVISLINLQAGGPIIVRGTLGHPAPTRRAHVVERVQDAGHRSTRQGEDSPAEWLPRQRTQVSHGPWPGPTGRD